jgi:hypothetical protein
MDPALQQNKPKHQSWERRSCSGAYNPLRAVQQYGVGRAVTLRQTHSLPSFGLWGGWCDLAMCVAVER